MNIEEVNLVKYFYEIIFPTNSKVLNAPNCSPYNNWKFPMVNSELLAVQTEILARQSPDLLHISLFEKNKNPLYKKN